jgi:uncharacterized protein YecT (DUF1311 family)
MLPMPKLIMLFTLLPIFVFSQPREFTQEDSMAITKQLNFQVTQFRASLEAQDDYETEDVKKIIIQFRLDTFIIEQFMTKQLEIDYSTMGMIDASFRAEKEYDRLLNGYYKKLLDRLKESDRKILKESESNWIKYRDSETALNYLLTRDEYSGGGSIQGVIYAGRVLEITRHRVAELFLYLL